jgi:hypothetical protein
LIFDRLTFIAFMLLYLTPFSAISSSVNTPFFEPCHPCLSFDFVCSKNNCFLSLNAFLSCASREPIFLFNDSMVTFFAFVVADGSTERGSEESARGDFEECS